MSLKFLGSGVSGWKVVGRWVEVWVRYRLGEGGKGSGGRCGSILTCGE